VFKGFRPNKIYKFGYSKINFNLLENNKTEVLYEIHYWTQEDTIIVRHDNRPLCTLFFAKRKRSIKGLFGSLV
jgi:hypothetical protein